MEWHPCHYENFDLICDLQGYEFEDDKWYRWINTKGETQEARYKQDAFDHFYPPPLIFQIEEAVGFQFLEDVSYTFSLLTNGYI